jgi:hypothetical protein
MEFNEIGFLRKIINNTSHGVTQNFLTKGNPQINYFKRVYHRFYNFSIQSFHMEARNKNILDFNVESQHTFTFTNIGDLLGRIFLILKLPKVITDDEIKLKYVNHVGLAIIKNIDLKIKGQTISSINGQKLYLLNKLTKETPWKDAYINIPEANMKYSHTKTSKLYNQPIDIDKEQLVIPLLFGFSKEPSLYLPLFLYKTEDIQIEVTLRSLEEIYTVETFDKNYWYYAKDPNVTGYTLPTTSLQFRKDALSNTDMRSISSFPTFAFNEQPRYLNTSNGNGSPYYLQRYESRKVSLPNTSITSQNIKYKLFSCCDSSDPTVSGTYTISCSIETEQIFIDKELKEKFNSIFIYSYLYEQCIEDTRFKNKTYTGTNELQLHIGSPIKQLILAIQRSDNSLRNEWLNFTNYEDSSLTEYKILQFQDNWWFSANAASKLTVSGEVYADGEAAYEYEIIPDNFQEFLFRYGPHGDAGQVQDTSGSGFSNWPPSINGNESVYTLKEIDTFRKLWKYRDASDIPQINTSNFNSTWKESPLDTLEIKFHTHIKEDKKPSIYYNTVQSLQHSNNILDAGVYMYSFNINTNSIQPHGSFKLNPTLLFILNIVLNKAQTFNDIDNAFTITPYALCYNIIHSKHDTFSLLYYNS